MTMSPMKRGGQAVMEQERPMDDHARAPWGDARLRDRLRCPSRGLRHDDSGGAHSITTAIAVAVAVPWSYRPQPTGGCQSSPGDWCVWAPLWFPAGATAPPRSPDASSLLTPSNRDNASPTGEEDRLLLLDQQVK